MVQSAHGSSDHLDPEPLHQIMYSFAPSRVLFAAVGLGVFSCMASGKNTPPAIARALKANVRGTRMLLDALVACELVSKQPAGNTSTYRLTPISKKFLVRESPDYLGSMVENDAMWDTWQHLPEAVLTGQPFHRVDDPNRGAEFFPTLVRSLHVISREPSRRAAQLLGAGRGQKGLRILDIACGSGVWGIALAEADAQARVTAQDYPMILNETRKFVEHHGLSDRYDYLPGDLKAVEFGKEKYDVAILGHILHIEGERSSRQLFRRLYRALRPGGRVAIAEMVPNDKRTGPPFALFFALNMLLNTAVGDTYTFAEYKDWLQQAGFAGMRALDIGSHSPLIVATKPSPQSTQRAQRNKI